MIYRLLTEGIVTFHALFVLFAAFGGLLTLRWRWVIWLHLPAVLWAGYVEISGTLCPLTALENDFRRLAGVAGYSESFIEHYILSVLYPAISLGPEIAARLLPWLGATVLLGNGALYLWLWQRKRGKPSGEAILA